MMKQKMHWVLTFAAVSLSLTIGKAWESQTPAPPPAGQGAGQGAPDPAARGGQPGAPGGRRGGAGVVTPVMDSTPPELPKNLKSGGLLIFSKTNGYRDDPSIQASNEALVKIATKRGWPVYVTEN